MRSLRSLLGLLVFVSWLGGSLFHVHPTAAPDCKVCQALQANQADVPARAGVPDAPARAQRLAADLPQQVAAPLLLVPQGRAPPLV